MHCMSFKVTLRPSGHTFSVGGNETVLAAALHQNIGLPHGCKSGSCGSCKAQALDGRWVLGQHAESALTPAEEAQRKLLLCCSRPLTDLVIEAREPAGLGDIQVRKLPCRIARIEKAAPDVAIVTLQLPADERLKYLAGQYLDFLLKDGKRRSFSIASAPDADAPISLHIRHVPGGLFTDALFGLREPAVKERDILRIEGPSGSFFLREDSDKPIVLLASGTGFAPIKAIAEYIFHKRLNRDDAGHAPRKVVLYRGCRSQRDLYLAELPRRWEHEQPNFSYVPVLSDALPDDAWRGRTGFVHRAVMDDWPDLSAHQVYACGVPVMVDAARRDFVDQCGLPQDEFFADAFTLAADRDRG
jgi:CDP-4-dehydro-6-deoxyglucose reductase, E3